MNSLTKQSIQIDIDSKDGTYSIDFIGCKLQQAYMIMKMITKQMESGEFFTDELEITDEDGNPVPREAYIALINKIKAEVFDIVKKH
jgi:hypothetical protein